MQGFFKLICRDSNPPVLARNLPFLGIVSALPFLLQNLPFFLFSSKKNQICYTYSLKSSKNSASSTSSLKQQKKSETIVKIQERLHSLWGLQMTKIDRNVVENLSC